MSGPTYTYSGDPSLSDLDFVRDAIGDTSTSSARLSDESILDSISRKGNRYLAAAACARKIASQFTGSGNVSMKKVGDLTIEYGGGGQGGSPREDYIALAKELERQAMASARPKWGGTSISRKQTVRDDSDLVPFSFRKGMHDNPEAGPQPGSDFTEVST